MTKDRTRKSIIIQCLFILLPQKFNRNCPLLCSKSAPNFEAILQSICELAISKSVAKGEKKIETNFKSTYLENGLMDSAQIWSWRCPTPRKFAQKISCVSIQRVSSYVQIHENGVFFTPVKCTFICCVPRFLGPHNTLPCVLIYC